MNVGVLASHFAPALARPVRASGNPDAFSGSVPQGDSDVLRLDLAARSLLRPAAVRDKKVIPMGNLLGDPLLQPDGSVQIMGNQGWVRLDATLDLAASVDLRGEDLAPANTGCALGPDQTLYFTTEKGRLRGLKEGQQVLDLEPAAAPAGPVYRTPDGRLALATEDHRIRFYTPEGHPAGEWTVPEPEQNLYNQKTHGHRMTFGRYGSTYVQTSDGRVLCYDARGEIRWTSPQTFNMRWYEPVESGDGRRLYLSGLDRRFRALDTETGREAWSHELHSMGLADWAAPLEDGQGNVYTFSRGGTIYKFSPRGQELKRFETGCEFTLHDGFRAHMELDARGNLCVAASPEQLQVFSPDGGRLVTLTSEQLFGQGKDRINQFALTPDRNSMILTGGHYSFGWQPSPYQVAVVDLPSRHDTPSGSVREGADHVLVGGIRIRRRTLAPGS